MTGDARLRIFIGVADAGSFTLAAKRLGISQPAVSQSIASLEEACGYALVERGRGGVTLTDKGHVFYVYAQRILSLYSELGDALDGKLVKSAAVVDLGGGKSAEISVRDGKLEIDLKSSNY
jgi:molybdate transport repressor ModE-like protein